jgi:hypothetical protein
LAEVLQGENLIEARELLREIIGAVHLHPDTDHLIAKFERSEIPLLAVANGRWIGSGGSLIEYPTAPGLPDFRHLAESPVSSPLTLGDPGAE